MQGHGNHRVYVLVNEEPVTDLPFMPVNNILSATLTNATPEALNRDDHFRFGRMFPHLRARKSCEQTAREMLGLVELGLAMNVPRAEPREDESEIPAGYTYLAQFISHEITFDKATRVPTGQIDVNNLIQERSPSIDLDSLYCHGPVMNPALYENDGLHLKTGITTHANNWPGAYLPRDLPRQRGIWPKRNKAVIGDPRNDDNLPVSQTHLAFIKFHNTVVDEISVDGGSAADLFVKARAIVVRHFQWIVLHHFLPRILDRNVLRLVLDQAQEGRTEYFEVTDKSKLFMPVEFSVAAFRFGHSMIRDAYQWNRFHNSGTFDGPPSLSTLFELTHFAGNLENELNLPSDWIVDWRRFYDFSEIMNDPRNPGYNRAKKIDISFNFHLEKIPGFPHLEKREILRSIQVRNLLRGLALELPTGQTVANEIRAHHLTPEQKLTPAQIAGGPHESILRDYGFHENTPLWYYILKEAELGGGSRLGPVGSRIVAETLVWLVLNSDFSILKDGFRPHLGTRKVEEKFDMMDLLKYADIIFPVDEQ